MPQDEGKDPVAVHKIAVGVHCAHPVGVAVYRHADIGFGRQNGVFERPQVLGDRLRVDAAEDRVAVAPDLFNLDARAAQDVGQDSRCRCRAWGRRRF